jgi:hypothetical protein
MSKDKRTDRIGNCLAHAGRVRGSLRALASTAEHILDDPDTTMSELLRNILAHDVRRAAKLLKNH